VHPRSLFHMGKATLAANLGAAPVPLNVMVSVTNRCQARCRYCSIPDRDQRELSTRELLDLFDELRELGTRRIGLWGGEPLLRDDIGELVDHAKRRCGFHVSLDTNGYLVPRRLAELRNLDVLAISYDGPAEGHDVNREAGSHRRVEEALRLAARTHQVLSITVLTAASLGSVDPVLALADQAGFDATFQLLHLTSNLGTEAERALLPEPEALRATLRHLVARKRAGAPIANSLAYLEHLLAWPDHGTCQSTERRGPRCWAGKLFCNVDTDGKVYPCSRLIDRVPARSIRDGGFAAAYRDVASTSCRGCTASSLVEYNLVHSLHPGAIWNWVRQTAS